MNIVHKIKDKGFKKDVAPRKDFTKVQKLVSNYLDKKRSGKQLNPASDSDGYISRGPVTVTNYNSKTLQRSKENKNDVLKYENQKDTFINNLSITNHPLKHSRINPPGEDDIKLMTILDNLEEEVKNMELNSNEKVLFDEKIRKIYGALIGKPNLVHQEFKLLSKDSMNESITSDINFKNLPEVDRFNADKYNTVANYKNKMERNYGKNAKSMFIGGNENFEDRKLRNIHDLREKFNHGNLHSRNDGYEYYPLGSERRRYYHQKCPRIVTLDMFVQRSKKNTNVADRTITSIRTTCQIGRDFFTAFEYQNNFLHDSVQDAFIK
ncbi:jg11588 [Pararge aegeria aegeria]|uniref:Jg11588 protein n=1 Tax=Pararge aegeria aegeria TaxID=348720 RepID=A0A8S4RU43_9NEOP|nr:jg11588 [Pararge aegeria aegeria]